MAKALKLTKNRPFVGTPTTQIICKGKGRVIARWCNRAARQPFEDAKTAREWLDMCNRAQRYVDLI